MTLTPLLVPLDLGADFLNALNVIMQPIYWAISGVLVGFHSLFSQFLDPAGGLTWVLSIVSLTVVVRTLLIPLFVRQINSSRKMQLLGPKMKALQEKYGTDRERLGQEQMKLYKDEGVNPFASCMPLLLQMPIFIGLFNVLNGVSNGVAVGYFFEREPELVDSLRQATIFGGASLAGLFAPGGDIGRAFTQWGATQTVAALLIVGMTVTLFITQLQMMRKNMPPEALTGQMAQQQKIMLYTFPLMYLFFGISVPIGVMIYWFASNLWTLGQQWILIHNSPSPNTPAYLDWEERLRAKGKDPEEVLRKRLGMDRKPKATVADDPTKVARQNTTRPAKATPAAEPAKTESPDPTTPPAPAPASGERQTIARQQPSRQSRAKRKKS
nr:membrane protein insertase YidC [Propionibacterium sp.]